MRPTRAIVDLGVIQQNYRLLSGVCDGAFVCPVVKADAYGHGAVAVVQALQEFAPRYVAVATVEEGVELRQAGYDLPILVMGALAHEQAGDYIDYDLTCTGSSIEKLQTLQAEAFARSQTARVHIKIDTGMGRLGVQWNRVQALLDYMCTTTHLQYEGIFSHFADSCDAEFTQTQYDRFMQVVQQAEDRGFAFELRHISSTRGAMLYPEYRLDMVRIGIGLYGIEPELDMQVLPVGVGPVLSWETTVGYFKVLEHGCTVSYGMTYQVEGDYERIVTLPVGYADGYPRRLSNPVAGVGQTPGQVIINGELYPIVGRICMDQCMVSLGQGGAAYVGDRVVLIGCDGDRCIRASDIARCIGTTTHEITTCIGKRVPRVYMH